MHDTGDYSISDLAELFSVSRPTVYRTLGRQAPATWRRRHTERLSGVRGNQVFVDAPTTARSALGARSTGPASPR